MEMELVFRREAGPLRVLVTNDDGIHAEGIKALWRALESVAEVFVAAPDRERSAVGHGITVHRPLRVREMNFSGNRVRGWVVDGTPADCVKLCLEALIPAPPDLLISGINLGANLGTDVLYSGTVSAAIEGIINGVPSLAVSLAADNQAEPDFRCAAAFTRALLGLLRERRLPPGTLLNINVPPCPPRGVRVTRLGFRRYVNVIDRRTDPRGRVYFWMAGEPLDVDDGDPDTDVRAVADGYISVTPVHFDLTNHEMIAELKTWPLHVGG